jgi:hypothetical protein
MLSLKSSVKRLIGNCFMANSNTKNRAKSSGAKDAMGLVAVIFSILLLFYLLVENYMGYTGIQRLFMDDSPSVKRIKK